MLSQYTSRYIQEFPYWNAFTLALQKGLLAKHFLNEERSRDAATKKSNTSGVGINNIIRKSIYLLTTTSTNNTLYYTF